MLFTCTLAREGLSVKHEPLEANSKILGGPRQIRRMLIEESGKSLSLTLDRGPEGHIARCSKKMAVQVCTKL
jgi:hypothetical protein